MCGAPPPAGTSGWCINAAGAHLVQSGPSLSTLAGCLPNSVVSVSSMATMWTSGAAPMQPRLGLARFGNHGFRPECKRCAGDQARRPWSDPSLSPALRRTRRPRGALRPTNVGSWCRPPSRRSRQAACPWRRYSRHGAVQGSAAAPVEGRRTRRIVRPERGCSANAACLAAHCLFDQPCQGRVNASFLDRPSRSRTAPRLNQNHLRKAALGPILGTWQ